MAVLDLPGAGPPVAIAGVRLRRLLSAELFHELVHWQVGHSATPFADACHERWTDLAASIIALPRPLEGLLAVSVQATERDQPELIAAFLVIGRGASPQEARERARSGLNDLAPLLAATLDYAEIKPMDDERTLKALADATQGAQAVEICRRSGPMALSHGPLSNVIGGFRGGADRRASNPASSPISIDVLFPWVPSSDPWKRLLETLASEPPPAAFLVHFRGHQRAPDACLDQARNGLATLERIATGVLDAEQERHTVLGPAVAVLRAEMLRRVAFAEGGMLAARVFLVGRSAPSAALQVIAQHAVDDISSRPDQIGAESFFRSGAVVRTVPSRAALDPLEQPSLDQLFGPAEASAVLRTPMPLDLDFPGLSTNRARTARMVGHSGDDCTLGTNVHRDRFAPAALDGPVRFRHTYVIGQTGTGKSTLMLNMILHDVAKGRGVAVLDPHGSLIAEVLSRMPAARADDVVLVDVTDVEYPVAFNILHLDAQEPHAYRFERDLLIDDLHSYLERSYSREMLGPMFESHFRTMLALILGSQPDDSLPPPNLMVLRLLYSNRRLRDALIARHRDTDPVLQDVMTEALAASGESSFKNMAPYVTSKFHRFIADAALRLITCQRGILDLGRIAAEKRILLFYLGKGRFGDHAAGLLASQLVSRLRGEIMRRGTGAQATPFYLYADEFHLFADQRFAELMAEARKFGLSLTVAHQYLGQLPAPVTEAVLGNAGTLVMFRVGAADAEVLEPVLSPTFSRRDLAGLPNFRAYVKTAGTAGPLPFSIETAVPDAPTDDRSAAIIAASRARFGRPREVVEREVAETYAAYAGLGVEG